MGLFSNFEKPGPGVNKNAPRPKGLKLFFELYFRKIGSYIQLNFFYLISMVPSIAIMWYIIMLIINDFALLDNQTIIAALFLGFVLSLVICMAFGLSPFSSGFHYVLRNFSFEKHAFVFSDFINKYRENSKASWIIYITDLVVTVVSVMLLRAYFILFLGNSFFIAPLLILIVAIVVYSLMAPYKWTMLITFDLTKKQIYKNALFFVLGDLKTTLRHFALTSLVVILFVLFVYLIPALGIILFVLSGISIYGLVSHLNIYKQMQEFISQSPGGHDNIK